LPTDRFLRKERVPPSDAGSIAMTTTPTPISSVGNAARGTLHAGGAGSVLAVFRRSFYVRFGSDLVCVGPLALRRGPLNALYATVDPVSWLDCGLAPGAEVRSDGRRLEVDDRFAFDFGPADVWEPPAAPLSAIAPLDAGVQLLAAMARQRSPGGLGALLWLPANTLDENAFEASDPLLRAALPPVAAVRRWLAAALARVEAPPPAIDALIGLGPGLTPSGDDFLCGAMAALHYLHRADVASRLAAIVLPRLSATNLISAAYLRCASTGDASSVLFDVLDCLHAADELLLAQRLDAVDRVGHTSGWDCLAGAGAVCAEIAVFRSAHAGDQRGLAVLPPCNDDTG
jgi:hypothetical protein